MFKLFSDVYTANPATLLLTYTLDKAHVFGLSNFSFNLYSRISWLIFFPSDSSYPNSFNSIKIKGVPHWAIWFDHNTISAMHWMLACNISHSFLKARYLPRMANIWVLKSIICHRLYSSKTWCGHLWFKV